MHSTLGFAIGCKQGQVSHRGLWHLHKQTQPMTIAACQFWKFLAVVISSRSECLQIRSSTGTPVAINGFIARKAVRKWFQKNKAQRFVGQPCPDSGDDFNNPPRLQDYNVSQARPVFRKWEN